MIDWMFYKHLGIIGFLGIFWKSEFKLFFLFYLIYIIDPLLKIKKLKTIGKQDDVDLSKNNNVYFVNPDPSMSMSFEKCNEGVLLTFTFNNPEKKGCFVGDLGLVWKGTNLRPRGDFSQNPIYNPTESSPSSLVEPEFGDKTLIDKIDRLDKSSKNELKDLLSGRVISEKFPLLPRPKITRITEVSKTQPINLSESLHINYNKVPHTNLDSIETEISKYKQNNTLPNYRDLVRSVPDPSTVLRKKMRQDLIINFLKSKGIE